MSGTREGFGRLVWVPDTTEGYKLCKLRDIGSETMTAELLDGGTGLVSFF